MPSLLEVTAVALLGPLIFSLFLRIHGLKEFLANGREVTIQLFYIKTDLQLYLVEWVITTKAEKLEIATIQSS